MDGTETGYSITVRDPEFSDEDFTRFLALSQYEAGVCKCGVHESLASDKSNYFAFDYRVCNVCKGLDQIHRLEAAEMKRLAPQFENAPDAAPRPTDGRHLMIRQESPLAVAARRGRLPASPQ